MPAKAEKQLKTIPFTNRATLNRPMRTKKMARPVCETCSERGGAWWETCPHNPYFSIVAEPGPAEFVIETNEAGEEVILEEKPGPVVRKRSLNIHQVPDEVKVYSGRGVPWSLEHGFKFPEDLGYAPLCEFYNCWTPNPKFKTKFGNYCTEDQARIMVLRTRGIAINADPTLRAEQLAGVTLG